LVRNEAMMALGEMKMQRAWEKYGDEFADAYDALVRNRDNPATRTFTTLCKAAPIRDWYRCSSAQR
jgi:hypothetical protein